MIDLMLRTSTMKQCDDAMVAAGVAVLETDTEGIVSVVAAEGFVIDRIGPCGPDSRYHANLRGTLTTAQIAALPTFTPLPVTPYRVFFDLMRLFAVILLAGCTSATATIANEANDIQAASARARAHLHSATAELDQIDASAASVHTSVAYVSDDESPIWGTAKFLSVAVVAGCIAAVVYKLKK